MAPDWAKILDIGFAAFVAVLVLVRLEPRLRSIENYMAILVDRDRKRRIARGKDPDAFTPVVTVADPASKEG